MRTKGQTSFVLFLIFGAILAGILQGLPDTVEALCLIR